VRHIRNPAPRILPVFGFYMPDTCTVVAMVSQTVLLSYVRACAMSGPFLCAVLCCTCAVQRNGWGGILVLSGKYDTCPG